MTRRRGARFGLVLGFLVSTLSIGTSCYRLQIDLTDGGAPAASADTGDAGAASLGGAGGDPAIACDATPLDPVQERCRGLLKPTVADCHDGDPAGWDGCYAGGCAVCSNKLVEYPYYKDWHPCCEVNTTCNRNTPVTCNVRCPPPTEHDKIAPCFVIPP